MSKSEQKKSEMTVVFNSARDHEVAICYRAILHDLRHDINFNTLRERDDEFNDFINTLEEFVIHKIGSCVTDIEWRGK